MIYEVLPQFPWRGPPLPRKLGVEWKDTNPVTVTGMGILGGVGGVYAAAITAGLGLSLPVALILGVGSGITTGIGVGGLMR